MQAGNSTLRRGGTGTFGSYLLGRVTDYGRIPAQARWAHLAGTTEGNRMKTLKWYVYRASMLMGSLAAFGIVVMGAKRW